MANYQAPWGSLEAFGKGGLLHIEALLPEAHWMQLNCKACWGWRLLPLGRPSAQRITFQRSLGRFVWVAAAPRSPQSACSCHNRLSTRVFCLLLVLRPPSLLLMSGMLDS